MINIIGPSDQRQKPMLNFIKCINTTSQSKAWSRGLSPFLIGPCKIEGEGISSLNMENAWQYSKVYKQHIAEDGEPSAAYYKWAWEGWANPRAVRYPMGKGAIPEYSIWNGEKLDYIEARKKIYIPLYSEAVRKTLAWQTLKNQYEMAGMLRVDLTLWDFDGYDHRALGMSWDDVINDPNRKMGHAFVLGMMLEGKI